MSESYGTYGTYDPAELPERKATTPQSPTGTLRGEDGSELPSFDPRWQEPFEGLLYLGALTKTFDWLGHKFTVRTLGPDEQLAIAVVTRPYVGTSGEQLAYTTAVAAMATVSVDGQELPEPIGEDSQIAEWAQARFTFVSKQWHGYTIAKVFEQYLELEGTVSRVVEAMGKAFGSTASTPGSNDTSE